MKAFRTGAILGLTLALLSSCGPTPGTPATSSAELSAAQHEILRLVEAARPIEETFTSDVYDYHFLEWQEILGNLKENGSTLLGEQSLRALREVGNPAIQVETSLLTVAAHAAPEKTKPYLEELILEYGHPMHLRAEAVMLLAETHPERAIEIFKPLLEARRHHKTYPDMEFFVRAWTDANERAGQDPTPVLANVATNLFMQDAARHFAVKDLGKHPSAVGRQALEAVIIESTGNGVLRRYAAQALTKSVPREEACVYLQEVMRNEAELNMVHFLVNLIAHNCGDGPMPDLYDDEDTPRIKAQTTTTEQLRRTADDPDQAGEDDR